MNRAPGTIWPFVSAAHTDIPASGGWVRTDDDDLIQIVIPRKPGDESGAVVRVTRRRARLIAKRINQCLDATRRS